MIRQGLFFSWLVAGAVGLAAPVPAQSPETMLDTARAAEAALDFTTALKTLGSAIAAVPDDPAPRIARARLHEKMNRPSLALADLDAVLAADPGHRDALLARGQLYLALNAFARAGDDFSARLEAAPDDVEALVGRAQARARSGLTRLALADYDAAISLAPDRPGLAEARAALAAPAQPRLAFDPAMMMDPAFRVNEGADDAAARAVIVHAGNDLPREEAMLPRATYAEALDAGRLSVTHLFTYTGQDSAIWANLALICAGSEGFAATWAALTTREASAALADLDAGRGRGAFEALITNAYDTAGLAPETATDCAFSRGQAVAYLANWTAKSEGDGFHGATVYDSWPVFLLDGAVVGAETLRATLVAMMPAEPADSAPADAAAEIPVTEPEDVATAAESQPEPPAPGVVDDAPPEESPSAGAAPDSLASRETEATAPPPVAAPAPEFAAPTPEGAAPAPLPEGLGPVDETARIPVALRGVWAPSLVDCIAYTDRIDTADTLDAALPALNPLDGPPIGTVLLTSDGLRLFNAVGTRCALVSVTENDDAPWRATLACRNAIAPDVAVAMTLSRIEADGPAPRFAVAFGPRDDHEVMQCRPLGGLGRDFAPLWEVDTDACSATAPVAGATFRFSAAGGGMTLSVTPDTAPDGTGAALVAHLDGTAVGAPAAWSSENRWDIPLGPFDAAAEDLARGLLLDVRGAGGEGWSRTLPLLGSGAAMAALGTCAAR